MQDAIAAQNSGDLQKAKKIYLDILKKDKTAIGAAINLSAIYLKTSEDVLGLLLPFVNENAPAELWFNLGLGYAKAAHEQNAIVAFENTLTLKPDFHAAKYELSKLLDDNNAILLISEAIKLAPQKEEYWIRFAVLLIKVGENIEAAKLLTNAINSGVKSAKMCIQLGLCYWNVNDLINAKMAFEFALQLEPNNPEALWQLSLLNLKAGNFADGWRGLWTRFHPDKDGGIPFPQVNKPVWEGGEVDTLLVLGEQGFGDNIQFARFIPQIKAKKIYFAPRKELLELFRASPVISNAATVVDIDNPPEFDAWVPIMELAPILGATSANTPFKNGFLVNNPKQKDSVLKVGLVWQGNPLIKRLDSLRSLTLKELSPLFSLPNVEFYALQQGYGKEQLSEFSAKVKDAGSFANFYETSKFIDTLDLVITIDSSVAHLSAGMNKPTWIMLPFVNCWRWGVDTDKSYWYNSVTLFRQNTPNDWQGVVQNIKTALQNFR